MDWTRAFAPFYHKSNYSHSIKYGFPKLFWSRFGIFFFRHSKLLNIVPHFHIEILYLIVIVQSNASTSGGFHIFIGALLSFVILLNMCTAVYTAPNRTDPMLFLFQNTHLLLNVQIDRKCEHNMCL